MDVRIGERFVLDRARPFAGALVCMSVPALEQLFRHAAGQYLEAGEEANAGRRDAVVKYWHAAPADKLLAPTVAFSMRLVDGIEAGVRARFMDGRHRFCVLRDAGAEWINVGCQRNWAKLLVEAGCARFSVGEDEMIQGGGYALGR